MVLQWDMRGIVQPYWPCLNRPGSLFVHADLQRGNKGVRRTCGPSTKANSLLENLPPQVDPGSDQYWSMVREVFKMYHVKFQVVAIMTYIDVHCCTLFKICSNCQQVLESWSAQGGLCEGRTGCRHGYLVVAKPLGISDSAIFTGDWQGLQCVNCIQMLILPTIC